MPIDNPDLGNSPFAPTTPLPGTAPGIEDPTQTQEQNKGDLTEAVLKGPVRLKDIDIIVMPKGYTGPLDNLNLTTPEPIDRAKLKEEEMENLDSIAIDSIKSTLSLDTAVESDAGMLFPGVTIAKSMVQEYPQLDGKILKVFKPAKELEAALDYAENKPITTEHPTHRRVTSRDEIHGAISNLTYHATTGELKSDIFVSDSKLIADIKAGTRRDVSIGFDNTLDMTPGVSGDDSYEAVQTGIHIDHVAVTKEGRCSLKDGCGIKQLPNDSAPTKVTLESLLTQPKPNPTADNTHQTLAPEIMLQLDELRNEKRVSLISHISSKLPRLERDTLDTMTIQGLEQTKLLLDSGLNPAQPGVGYPTTTPKSVVDAAYEKIE